MFLSRNREAEKNRGLIGNLWTADQRRDISGPRSYKLSNSHFQTVLYPTMWTFVKNTSNHTWDWMLASLKKKNPSHRSNQRSVQTGYFLFVFTSWCDIYSKRSLNKVCYEIKQCKELFTEEHSKQKAKKTNNSCYVTWVNVFRYSVSFTILAQQRWPRQTVWLFSCFTVPLVWQLFYMLG